MKNKEKQKTHLGLDSIIEQIEKKGNVSSFDKSKKDWTTYVKEKQIEKELQFNRKDGFLLKKRFIDETNIKLMEDKRSTARKYKSLKEQ
jgi:hypothetical protein